MNNIRKTPLHSHYSQSAISWSLFSADNSTKFVGTDLISIDHHHLLSPFRFYCVVSVSQSCPYAARPNIFPMELHHAKITLRSRGNLYQLHWHVMKCVISVSETLEPPLRKHWPWMWAETFYWHGPHYGTWSDTVSTCDRTFNDVRTCEFHWAGSKKQGSQKNVDQL